MKETLINNESDKDREEMAPKKLDSHSDIINEFTQQSIKLKKWIL